MKTIEGWQSSCRGGSGQCRGFKHFDALRYVQLRTRVCTGNDCMKKYATIKASQQGNIMKTGQQVQVVGNGINALCSIELIPVDGYRKACNFVRVIHPNGKLYWVNEKNCEAV